MASGRLDFMHDALYGRKTFRTLNVIDEADRGALGIDVAMSIPASRVIRFLEQLIEIHGQSWAIRCNNGPELTSQTFTEKCRAKAIVIRFIQPGKPDQNALVERFNRSYREVVLNTHLLEAIGDVQKITDRWLKRHNEIRPHDTPRSLAPSALPREAFRSGIVHFRTVYLTESLSDVVPE
jgi:putative transposase